MNDREEKVTVAVPVKDKWGRGVILHGPRSDVEAVLEAFRER